MKVILTSKGFENEITLKKIMDKIEKKIEDIRMLVIPTARKYEYKQDKYLKDYIELGFKEENIVFFDDDNIEKYIDLDIDMIFVCGGNTFILKHYLEKSGFIKYIYDYLEKGVIYLGASAGSHLATESIKHVIAFDENNVKETNMKGLGLLKGILICHYDKNRENIYLSLKEKWNDRIITLTDEEIIYLKDDKWIKE